MEKLSEKQCNYIKTSIIYNNWRRKIAELSGKAKSKDRLIRTEDLTKLGQGQSIESEKI